MGVLLGNLPRPHQRTRSLPLHSHTMAFSICNCPCLAIHAHKLERRLLFLLRGLFGGYGDISIFLGAGDEGEDLGEDG